jgi:citrate lyase subunit beta/citryl-CoA lyase
MNRIATAGNKGDGVRSDCFVTLQLKDSGGISVNLKSKVEALFGDDIRNQAVEILKFFEITNAEITIEDSGALPFVIAARIEAAVKKLITTEKNYLFDVLPENRYQTVKDRFRFTRLYLPGNTPKLMINAGIHQPDGIILDLEDAVALDKKDEARFLVRNALCAVNFYGAERMVRINQGDRGLEDLEYVVPYNVNMILIPKVESAERIVEVENRIKEIKEKYNIDYDIWYMPILESALGVENAFEIAKASPNVVAMAIGLEDYTADIGVQRTLEGTESLYARMRMVNACKAAGIQPIDSVFSDVADMEGLLENVKKSKALGFEGMGCIHPRQIAVIKEGFKPSETELEKAKKIMIAFEKAKKEGKGVISLGTKMIDPPVVKRAEKTVKLAVQFGMLPENWLEQEMNNNN